MGQIGTITQSGLRISIEDFKQCNESIKQKDRVLLSARIIQPYIKMRTN